MDPIPELLLLCARTRMDGATADRIRVLVREGIEWNTLLRIGGQHGMVPLLYWQLNAVCPEAVPPEVLETLRDPFRALAVRNVQQTRELLRILDRFAASGVHAIPFKGLALAWWVYGNVSLRQVADLDLLIQPSDIRRAGEMMLSLGYRMFTPLNAAGLPREPDTYEYRFVREESVVELRWRLSPHHFLYSLDIGWLGERCSSAEFGVRTADLGEEGSARCSVLGARRGQEQVPPLSSRAPSTEGRAPAAKPPKGTARSVVIGHRAKRGHRMRRLPPEELLLILCMHGAKHAWDRLMWICDVAELVRAHPDLDWERAASEARKIGGGRMLALGLILAHHLLGAAVPERVLRAAAEDPRVRWIETQIRAWYQAGPDGPDGPLDMSDPRVRRRVELGLTERLADRMRYQLHRAQVRIVPNAKDQAFIRLPASLRFLYYVLKPIRKAGERFHGGSRATTLRAKIDSPKS